MSKKSTSRTESDGDAECSSTNGRSCNFEKAKCSTRPHLSDKQDSHLENKRPTDIYHCKNHTNDWNYSVDPYENLNETIYGNSDRFNKNLESLRERLRQLNVYDNNFEAEEPVTSYNMHQRFDTSFDSHSCAIESSPDNKSDYNEKPTDYLSTTETCINLLSILPNCERDESCQTAYEENLCLTTIYKAKTLDNSYSSDYNKSDSDCSCADYLNCKEAIRIKSNESYKVPSKKFRRETDLKCSKSKELLELMPETTSVFTFSTASLVNELISSSPRSVSNNFYKHSSHLDINSPNYAVPVKRKCVRSKTPVFVDETVKNISPEKQLIYTKPLKEGGDACNTREECKNKLGETKSDSLASDLELGLNLPSSIGDLTSSAKTTPLKPRLVIINDNNKKVPLIPNIEFMDAQSSKTSTKIIKSSKIRPISVSSSARTPSTPGDSNISKRVQLYKKYYESTPDISSKNSTPSANVSIGLSSNCSSSNSISEVNLTDKSFPQTNCEPQQNFQKSVEEIKIFNNILYSSLDIPKIWMNNYSFPVFTKITNSCGSFSCFSSPKDTVEKEKCNILLNCGDCYKNKAQSLLNSPRLQIMKRTTCDRRSDEQVIRDQLCYKSKDTTNNTRNQSTEMSFYSVPSTPVNDAFNNIILNKRDRHTSPDNSDDSEKCAGCCCYPIFFSRTGNKFFT